MNDIEYNLYICGVYRGKRKAGRDSLIGRLAALDMAGAGQRVAALTDELNAIEGVEASARIEDARREQKGGKR